MFCLPRLDQHPNEDFKSLIFSLNSSFNDERVYRVCFFKLNIAISQTFAIYHFFRER